MEQFEYFWKKEEHLDISVALLFRMQGHVLQINLPEIAEKCSWTQGICQGRYSHDKYLCKVACK